MKNKEMFDRRAARASMCELHVKTKELKGERKVALAVARQAKDDRVPTVTLLYDSFEQLRRRAMVRGSCARYWGLIYAYMRGMPYRRVEQRVHEGNHPSAFVLANLLLEVAHEPTVRVERDGYAETPAQRAMRDEMKDDIAEWLTTAPEVALQQAA